MENGTLQKPRMWITLDWPLIELHLYKYDSEHRFIDARTPPTTSFLSLFSSFPPLFLSISTLFLSWLSRFTLYVSRPLSISTLFLCFLCSESTRFLLPSLYILCRRLWNHTDTCLKLNKYPSKGVPQRSPTVAAQLIAPSPQGVLTNLCCSLSKRLWFTLRQSSVTPIPIIIYMRM